MKPAAAKAQELADVVRWTAIDTEALRDLLGPNDRHDGIVVLILLERAPEAVSNAQLSLLCQSPSPI